MMAKKIEKKQFMGDKTLMHFVIPEGTTRIGDWAFAGCTELAWLALPSCVEQIGREAFKNCANLKAVYCYDAREPKTGGMPAECRKDLELTDDSAELLAIALRFFKESAGLIPAMRGEIKEWFSLWDEMCIRFLEQSDEDGFRPFLAGGEEDYDDEMDKRETYCREKRLLKARVILIRLLNCPEKDKKAYYQEKLRENDMSPALLHEPWEQPGKVLALYEEAGLLNKERCRELLNCLPEEFVEMRAMLLKRTGSMKMDEWML